MSASKMQSRSIKIFLNKHVETFRFRECDTKTVNISYIYEQIFFIFTRHKMNDLFFHCVFYSLIR